MLRAVSLLLLVAGASAKCASDCSGHGTCGANDRCTCYANWQGGDCSERTCPFGEAWATTVTGNDNGHSYAECSNRGSCDRKTGVCECDAAYDGFACNRHSCANECNGHGTCETMRELGRMASDKQAAAQASAHATKRSIHEFPVRNTATYNGWDADKSRSCVCDGGWTGATCNQRQCPRGDDPLTLEVDITQTTTTSLQAHEVQNVSIVAAVDQASGRHFNMNGGEVVFSYTDLYNGVWTTRPITLPLVKTWDGRNSHVGAIAAQGLEDAPNSQQVLNIQPGLSWAAWGSTSGTLSATKTYAENRATGKTEVYYAMALAADVTTHANGAFSMKKGDWIAITDTAAITTCHLQVYESFEPAAGSGNDVKIVADPIQGPCVLAGTALSLIWSVWKPYVGETTVGGSSGSKVTALNLATSTLTLSTAHDTGADDADTAFPILHPGSWIRIASATVIDEWCDMQVQEFIDDGGAIIKIDPASVTSTVTNSLTGTQLRCESFTTGTSSTRLNGKASTDDVSMYYIDNHMLVGTTTNAGTYHGAATTDVFKINSATNVISRYLTGGATALNYDTSDRSSMMPGAIFSLVAAATGVAEHNTLCHGIVKTAPIVADEAFTAEAPPATIAGKATTSCLTYLTSSASVAASLWVEQAGNAAFYSGADSRAPNWFTGVSAGDMITVNSGGRSASTQTTAATTAQTVDDNSPNEGTDSTRLHVARVSSDGSAVHFSQGSAPGGKGMFPMMMFHDNAAGNVPLIGMANIDGSVIKTGTIATPYTDDGGGAIHGYATRSPDFTGSTTIFQSWSAATCGWCAVDEATVNCAADAQRALQELPNQVVDGATVAMNGNSLGRYGFTISFGPANSGDQHNIVMQGAGCNDDGCQPRYHGMYIQQSYTHHTGNIVLDATTSKYSYIGTTTDSSGSLIAGINSGLNSNMVAQGHCGVVGGEKFVPYYYVSTGDSTGEAFQADSCTDAGGIQFVTDNMKVSTSAVGHTWLRLRKLSDFNEDDTGAYGTLQDKSSTFFRSVTSEITRGTTESSECSGRGNCDSSSGLCECFEGYTGESCATQTVLI